MQDRDAIASFLLSSRTELLVALEAIDPITGAPFQARHSYTHDDIVWDHGFQPAVSRQEDGTLKVEWDYFHALVPVPFGAKYNDASDIAYMALPRAIGPTATAEPRAAWQSVISTVLTRAQPPVESGRQERAV